MSEENLTVCYLCGGGYVSIKELNQIILSENLLFLICKSYLKPYWVLIYPKFYSERGTHRFVSTKQPISLGLFLCFKNVSTLLIYYQMESQLTV